MTQRTDGQKQNQHEAASSDQIIVEEYKALRAEGLRCASVLSNAVWIAITSFGVTTVAVLAAHLDATSSSYLILIILLIQSVAASSMYLQELTKYVRTGNYIRAKIEQHFIITYSNLPTLSLDESKIGPLYWEHWIKNRRATSNYVVSFVLIQIPQALSLFFVSSVAAGFSVAPPFCIVPPENFQPYGFCLIVLLVVANLLAMRSLVSELNHEAPNELITILLSWP